MRVKSGEIVSFKHPKTGKNAFGVAVGGGQTVKIWAPDCPNVFTSWIVSWDNIVPHGKCVPAPTGKSKFLQPLHVEFFKAITATGKLSNLTFSAWVKPHIAVGDRVAIESRKTTYHALVVAIHESSLTVKAYFDSQERVVQFENVVEIVERAAAKKQSKRLPVDEALLLFALSSVVTVAQVADRDSTPAQNAIKIVNVLKRALSKSDDAKIRSLSRAVQITRYESEAGAYKYAVDTLRDIAKERGEKMPRIVESFLDLQNVNAFNACEFFKGCGASEKVLSVLRKSTAVFAAGNELMEA